MSLRLLDFVAAFVDPDTLPSLIEPWRQLQAARRAAYEMPWSHAILRALELSEYTKLVVHEDGWMTELLGLAPGVERQALELLSSTGQIEMIANKWHVTEALNVDTRTDPAAARQLKAWWFDVGKERFTSGAHGVFSYNLFGVSNRDLARLQDLQRDYFRQLRSIVAASEPVENVAVVNLQLFSLLAAPKAVESNLHED